MRAAPRFAMFSVRVHLGAVAVAEQRLREAAFHNACSSVCGWIGDDDGDHNGGEEDDDLDDGDDDLMMMMMMMWASREARRERARSTSPTLSALFA